jgi:hypothetical protein
MLLHSQGIVQSFPYSIILLKRHVRSFLFVFIHFHSSVRYDDDGGVGGYVTARDGCVCVFVRLWCENEQQMNKCSAIKKKKTAAVERLRLVVILNENHIIM